LGALAAWIALRPGLAEAAQLDRALVASEPWRILTGHLSHFSASHLAYDLAVLIALGWACESRWPRRTRAALCLGLPVCSAAVLFGAPAIDLYRGLSGADSILLVLLAARLHVERAFRSAWTRHLPALVGILFLCKVGYELRTDAALFAGAAGRFVPVPLAHLAGGAVGLLAALWPARRPSRRRPASPARCGRAAQPPTATSAARRWRL
jgi:rhomboid family GlyGly-CTERM serine protease